MLARVKRRKAVDRSASPKMSSVPFSPSWPEGHVARVAGGIADISPVGAPEMRLREAPRRRQDSRQETAPARSQPEVSVIVLNYNGALWLENCLASLRRQTRANQIEVIVAD